MCCACNGGEVHEEEVVNCIDTNFNGEADSYGDTCSDHYGHESWCGNYDDDFVSAKICCACNGGNDGNELEMQVDPFELSWLANLSQEDRYVWGRFAAD